MKKYYRWFQQAKFGPLPFSAFLVFVLGCALVFSMRMEPPANRAADRGIASVESSGWQWVGASATGNTRSLPGPEELQIDCSGDNNRPPFVSKSPFIRFELEGCKVTEIKNSSNQFQASLFELSQQRTSSDFISLQQGENEILVRAQGQSGPLNLRLRVIYQ